MSEKDLREQPIKEVFKFFLNPPVFYLNGVSFEGSNADTTASTIDEYLDTSPYINRSRGSGINSYEEVAGNEVPPDQVCGVLSKKLSFSDDDFLDGGAGIEMIVKDQEEREKELTLQIANADVTGCSLWTPVSAKRLSVLSMTADVDTLKYQSYVSVSKYIAMRSEQLGSLSDHPRHSDMFLGHNTSTPLNKVQTEMPLTDMTIRDANELSVFQSPEMSLPWDSSFCPKFLYAVTPRQKDRESSKNFDCYISTTCLKKIQRVRAEEKKMTKNSNGKLSKNQSEFESMSGSCSKWCYDSVSNRRATVISQWKVEPQEIVLNSTKGNRIALINYSEHNLKFKAKFDGNVINVSPFIGTVSARSEIGLRIRVIRPAKKAKEYYDDDVTLICGNTEKVIKVHIFKEEKLKTSVRERSFVCF